MMKSPKRMMILLAAACVGFCGCQPDLQVTLTANSSYSEGEDVAGTVSITVSNTGSAEAKGTNADEENGYMVDLVLSQDNTVPVAPAVLPSPYTFTEDMLLKGGRVSRTDTLAAGANKTYTGHGGPIPPGSPSPAYLCAVVDPFGKVSESNEGNNTFCAEIKISPARRCVTFETPALGTRYEPPAQSPGDQVLVGDGIRVTVEEFQQPGGVAFNYSEVQASTPSFGVDSQFLWTNNMNVEFDFTGLGFETSKVTFQFDDRGGFENISINGDPTPPYVGELTSAPSPLGGVTLTISPPDAALGGKVERLRVGGQEFAIDQVCAWP